MKSNIPLTPCFHRNASGRQQTAIRARGLALTLPTIFLAVLRERPNYKMVNQPISPTPSLDVFFTFSQFRHTKSHQNHFQGVILIVFSIILISLVRCFYDRLLWAFQSSQQLTDYI